MEASLKRAVVYLDVRTHKALARKAKASSVSVSELLKDAAQALLAEDAHDVAVAKSRIAAPSLDFAEVVGNLKRRGKI